jgi:hypothetical protein
VAQHYRLRRTRCPHRTRLGVDADERRDYQRKLATRLSNPVPSAHSVCGQPAILDRCCATSPSDDRCGAHSEQSIWYERPDPAHRARNA